jgi:nitroimidazol reductase NimA-like FMN-containing flavoprotein (pyridoxamine 5'-phosphate oxidase superfamily)
LVSEVFPKRCALLLRRPVHEHRPTLLNSGDLRNDFAGSEGETGPMEQKAVEILNQHRLMAIATLRPDGWPQSTLVGYANDGLLLYFIISRRSQKFSNIDRDSRVSIAVGRDVEDPSQIKALSIAANASEVRDPAQRQRAIELVLERHPALARFGGPNIEHSAVMRAYCSIVTILDYSKGFGHSDMLTVGPGGAAMTPARDDDWGFHPATAEE